MLLVLFCHNRWGPKVDKAKWPSTFSRKVPTHCGLFERLVLISSNSKAHMVKNIAGEP